MFSHRVEGLIRFDSDSSLNDIEFLDANNNSVCPFDSYYDFYHRGDKEESYTAEEGDAEYEGDIGDFEDTTRYEESESEEVIDDYEFSRKEEEDIEHLLEERKRLTVGREYMRSTGFKCLHCMIFYRGAVPCIYLGKENGLEVFKPRKRFRCFLCKSRILHIKNRKRRRSKAVHLSADCAPGAPCKWLLSGWSCRCAKDA